MTTYIGYYRPVPQYLQESGARARAGDPSPDPTMRRLVTELPEKLPAGCSIVGSYVPGAGPVLHEPGPPSVMIVECDGIEPLQFISRYYTGFLQFHWVPAMSLGATQREREAAMAPAGVAAR